MSPDNINRWTLLEEKSFPGRKKQSKKASHQKSKMKRKASKNGMEEEE